MTHDHSAALARLDDLKGADPRSVFAELIRSGLQELIEPDERRDPESPLRWTTKSLRHLAEELTRNGR